MAVSLLFYALLKKKSLWRKNNKVYITLALILICCFLFIMLIASEGMYALALSYGFDFSNRKFMYDIVADLYEWSIFFLGNGFRFTHMYMMDRYERTLKAMNVLHSDVLTMYIDLGFIGSFLWFSYYLLVLPKKLQRHYGCYTSFSYCMLMVYSYICYTVDNVMKYFIFQLFLYMIVLVSISNSSERRKYILSLRQ